MQRGTWWLLLFAATLLVIVGVASGFAPNDSEIQLRYMAWSVRDGVEIPVNTYKEIPYLTPTLILALTGGRLLLDRPIWIGINILMSALLLLLLFRLGKTSREQMYLFPAAAITTTLPWMWYIGAFDFKAVMTLVLVILVFFVSNTVRSERARRMTIACLLVLIALTSFVGPLFGIVYLISKITAEKKSFYRLSLATAIAALLGISILSGWIKDENWWFRGEYLAGLTKQSQQAYERAMFEYRTNNYDNVLPLTMKRLVYNKFYFAYRDFIKHASGLLSLERVGFPGQSDATVSRNLWTSKGMSWLPFWMIPLVIFGIFQMKKAPHEIRNWTVILTVWGFLSLLLGKNENMLGNGIGIMLGASFVFGVAWVSLRNKFGKIAIAALILTSGFANGWHFLGNELYWRDNRPDAQMKIAEMTIDHSATQVSTVLGRSFFYYALAKQLPPDDLWKGMETNSLNGVNFAQFDFKETSPKAGIYVGFPGDFLGSKREVRNNDFSSEMLPSGWKLLEEYKLRDSINFGNGDFIWTVSVN